MAQIHSLYIFYYQIAIYKTKILRIAEVKGIQNNEVGKRGLCKPVSLITDSGHSNPFTNKSIFNSLKNNSQKRPESMSIDTGSDAKNCLVL